MIILFFKSFSKFQKSLKNIFRIHIIIFGNFNTLYMFLSCYYDLPNSCQDNFHRHLSDQRHSIHPGPPSIWPIAFAPSPIYFLRQIGQMALPFRPATIGVALGGNECEQIWEDFWSKKQFKKDHPLAALERKRNALEEKILKKRESRKKKVKTIIKADNIFK